MNAIRPDLYTLDATVAEFVQRSVSINVASHTRARGPAVSRAYGCLVDGEQLVLLLNPRQGAEVLEGVAETGAVAAVFSRPTTHGTVQLKGRDGRVEPWQPQDRQRVEEYLMSFRDELQQVGFQGVFFDGLVSAAHEELIRLRFTPREAYDQTPGANAGRPLTT